MNEKLYEALVTSLNALEAGADLESVAKRFPELKEELLPLLAASQGARRLAIPKVPEEAQRRSKARILQQAAGMRAADYQKTQRRRSMFFFPRLAVSLAIALLLMFSGTGLVRASSVALPGDNLYPVKRTWEDVRLMLVFSPESREELEVEFEQERLHEVDELLAEGRHETIKFAGILTQQDGNLWIVSGVPVQITPESRLPGTPVILGTAIVLEGRTNDRGFVEAEYIEILGSNIVLPTGVPTEIKSHEDSANNSSQEENDNGHQSEDEMDSSQDEDQNDNVKKDEIDDNSNITSGRNEYNNDDYSDDDRSGREHQTDGGGSEGEQDTNDDGGHD